MNTLILATSDDSLQSWTAEDFPALQSVPFVQADTESWNRAVAVFLDRGQSGLRDEIPDHCKAPLLCVADRQERERLEQEGIFQVFPSAPARQEWTSSLRRALRLARAERRVEHLRRLNRRRRREIRDLWRTGEIVREMTSTLYIEDILKSILHGVRRHLELDRVMLGLINGSSKREEIKVALGIDRDRLEGAVWAVDESSPVWTRLASRGTPMRVEIEQERGLPPFITRVFPKAFVKAPLIVRKQILGTIMCDRSRGEISARDLRLLRVFCQYAAIAIQNARLYYDVLKSEEELREAHDKLVRAERMAVIGQIAVSINHEINNPLCNISLIAQTVNDQPEGELSPRLRQMLADLEENVDRIQAVTRKLAGLKEAPLTEYLPNQMMVDLK
ncbi:MAG TPA: GAF domain-containing protein [Acidobacteriota bacterium]|nr:GAF domain-containing protein [Acidobacteriota bacterium]